MTTSYVIFSPAEADLLVWLKEQHGEKVAQLRKRAIEIWEASSVVAEQDLPRMLAESLTHLVENELRVFIGPADDPKKGLAFVFSDAAWGAFRAIDFHRLAQVILLKADENRETRYDARPVVDRNDVDTEVL